MRTGLWALGGVALGVTLAGAALAQGTLVSIVPDASTATFVTASGISRDGATVVGSGSFPGVGLTAYRWTQAGGIQVIPFPPASPGFSVTSVSATGVSDSGAWVAGSVRGVLVSTQQEIVRAYRWSAASDYVLLQPLAGSGAVSTWGADISGDGSRVLGVQRGASGQDLGIARWTISPVNQVTQALSTGLRSVGGLSQDGALAVGWFFSGSSDVAGLWTDGGGLSNLGTLAGSDVTLLGGCDDTGLLAVGQAVLTGGAGTRAVLWTPTQGFENLGTLAGFAQTRLDSISGDGTLAIGQAIEFVSGGPQVPVVWTRAGGIRRFTTFLSERGVSVPPGWSDLSPTAVSRDGSRIVGNGLRERSPGVFRTEAFLLTLGSGCDSVDFNNDGAFPDDADLADFVLVLGGGACAACNDADFNNDGVFPDDADLADLLRVLGGGSC